MDIVFSANNREEILKLPIVPPDLTWDSPQTNETFDTIQQGELNLIGLKGLVSFSISSFFPMKRYPFAKSAVLGNQAVTFFEKWRKKRVPIRVVITNKKGQELLNLAITIDNFTHGFDQAGDIQFTLDIKEYRFPRVT
ncbi:hypothetical protein ACQCVH_22255 [Bacillus infantis]|uniref:hypothetical protein n=1 Tax=Bacillus infantis TaxID=324767 RepID=UPI003CF4DC2C